MSTIQATPGQQQQQAQQQAPRSVQPPAQPGIVPGSNLPSVTPGPVDLGSVQQAVQPLNTVQASVTTLLNGLVTQVNRLATMPAVTLSDQMKKVTDNLQKLGDQAGGASTQQLKQLEAELKLAAQAGPVYSITIQEFAQQLSTSVQGLTAAVIANTPSAAASNVATARGN
jgi:hypothetical protein